jgi:tetratricopeptide (TPR) repeat protein
MTTGGSVRLGVLGMVGAVVGIGAAAGVLHARESHAPLPVSTERLMYLRSGRVADRVFLSFDALASDVYWMRAIQHYGRDLKSTRVTGRFELLQPLLDLTTSLDPHFNLAYRFGAIFLAMPPPTGPGETDKAIALLEKGLASNPTRWQYAHDIGFVHYWYTGNYEEAARWFDRAASMPGAPEWLRPLAALTLTQGGDRASARRLLTELKGSDESYISHAAERGLAQLQALDAIDQLQAIVERYHTGTGAYPRTWTEMIRAGLLRGVPADPTQTAFAYDPGTHRVTLAPDSTLNPLPRLLKAR